MPDTAQHPIAGQRVDIHTHVLPAIDDGARDVPEALEMLRMASEDGTSFIVATPHAARANPERIRYATEALTLQARNAGLSISILPGSEVKFSADLPEEYRAGKLQTINDNGYLLIEFSFSSTWTPLVSTTLYALQMAGVMPIVAHAERYPVVQENPRVLLELIATGIPVQVNAASLLGEDGPDSLRTAELLAKAGMVHLIASDGHRRDKRKPLLAGGIARYQELAGAERALLVQHNAVRVLTGRPAILPEPEADALKPPSRLHRALGRLLPRG